jgi:DNA-binding MarR family transcriptional regulator
MASVMDRPTYRTQHRKYSARLDRQEGAHGASYDRKQVLEFLNENSDSNGFLTKNCRVLAKEVGMSYQSLSLIISEFIEMGYMKKYGERRASRFRVLFHPDDCDWGPEWLAKFKEIRQKNSGAATEVGDES